MTEFNNIKFLSQTPKTCEVRYVGNTEQSTLSKIADYLGIRNTECSGEGGSASFSKEVANATAISLLGVPPKSDKIVTPSTSADNTYAATKANAEEASKTGGDSKTSITSDKVEAEYHAPEKDEE